MRSYKEFWEDAAANSVAGGGVSLPADAVPAKKKKSVYDGRTKAGRKFVEKMNMNKTKREEKKALAASKANLASVTVKEVTEPLPEITPPGTGMETSEAEVKEAKKPSMSAADRLNARLKKKGVDLDARSKHWKDVMKKNKAKS